MGLKAVSTFSGGSAPITSANFVDGVTPTGTINGTNGTDGNPTFTLPSAPSPAASLQLYKNGQEMVVGTAFTLSTLTITYLTGFIPVTGDIHRAWYRK